MLSTCIGLAAGFMLYGVIGIMSLYLMLYLTHCMGEADPALPVFIACKWLTGEHLCEGSDEKEIALGKAWVFWLWPTVPIVFTVFSALALCGFGIYKGKQCGEWIGAAVMRGIILKVPAYFSAS